jgi:excisionase family DNA binding protein
MSERPTPTNELPAFLTVPEVVERTRLSRSAVYEAIARGELRPKHFGRAVRIPVESFRAWCGERSP